MISGPQNGLEGAQLSPRARFFFHTHRHAIRTNYLPILFLVGDLVRRKNRGVEQPCASSASATSQGAREEGRRGYGVCPGHTARQF
jgi:hypothetical protein